MPERARDPGWRRRGIEAGHRDVPVRSGAKSQPARAAGAPLTCRRRGEPHSGDPAGAGRHPGRCASPATVPLRRHVSPASDRRSRSRARTRQASAAAGRVRTGRPRSVRTGVGHGCLHLQRVEGAGRAAGFTGQLRTRVSRGHGRTRTRARRRRRERARTVGVAARNARCAHGAGGALAGFRAA